MFGIDIKNEDVTEMRDAIISTNDTLIKIEQILKEQLEVSKRIEEVLKENKHN